MDEPKKSTSPKDFITRGDLISRGGSSWVYEGKWGIGDDAMPVAIKVINPDVPNSLIKNSEKFDNERDLLLRFGLHPSIIQLQTAIPESRELILECGEVELHRRLFSVVHQQQPKVERNRRVSYAVQIATGIAYIHSIPVLHRDLNLENVVLMSGETQAKIIDFGHARELSPSQKMFQGNVTFGMAGYMAPECRHAQYAVGTDAWAFGVMLWGLITYCDPRKSKEDYQPPSDFPGCSETQTLFMQSFWYREDPHKRPAMTEALVQEISNIFPERDEPKPLEPSKEKKSSGTGCRIF